MKKFILYFIIFILAMAFSGCDTNEIPEENIRELEPVISEAEDVPEEKEPEKEEALEEEKEKITLKLGPNGEEKECSVGDKIGEWKIAELFIEREDNGDYFAISMLFEGTVTLEGSIERNVIIEEGYDIVLDESSLEKMPYIIEGYFSEIRPRFLLDFSEEIENKPHLDWEETAKVRITVSNFSFDRAPRMSMDGFDVISIEYLDEEKKEAEELYEEIILNFGAVKSEGKIKVNKIVSLYNKTEGFNDGTALDETEYFIWAMSYLNYHSGYSTELFSHPDFYGWSYPAEYYESAVYEFFGVSAEKLRKGELYFPEQNLYNIGGGGGIGNVPYIILNGADEDEDKLILHLTMDYEQGYEEDFNMALTVKLLPDGGYNYISYLPE